MCKLAIPVEMKKDLSNSKINVEDTHKHKYEIDTGVHVIITNSHDDCAIFKIGEFTLHYLVYFTNIYN